MRRLYQQDMAGPGAAPLNSALVESSWRQLGVAERMQFEAQAHQERAAFQVKSVWVAQSRNNTMFCRRCGSSCRTR